MKQVLNVLHISYMQDILTTVTYKLCKLFQQEIFKKYIKTNCIFLVFNQLGDVGPQYKQWGIISM